MEIETNECVCEREKESASKNQKIQHRREGENDQEDSDKQLQEGGLKQNAQDKKNIIPVVLDNINVFYHYLGYTEN